MRLPTIGAARMRWLHNLPRIAQHHGLHSICRSTGRPTDLLVTRRVPSFRRGGARVQSATFVLIARADFGTAALAAATNTEWRSWGTGAASSHRAETPET